MMQSRNDVKEYAFSLCRTMLERTASRYERGVSPTVIDHVGYIPTFLEEFCRPFWGMAPVISENPEPVILSYNGKTADLAQWLSDLLFDGLDPGSENSWERYRDTGAGWGLDFQNLTELAGLLIGLYFCREKTWDRFSPRRRRLFADRIFSFCKGECERLAENNHIWFPLFCVLVLKKFGFTYPETERYLRAGLEALEALYLSDGWYSDGPFGRFDYYEAWSLHAYPLLWCLIEDASFPGYEACRARYLERAESFLSQYVYCFDADGAFPAFGRSLPYKFAAVCVFPLAALAGCDIDYGLARRIMLKNLNYFAENMRLNDGGVLPAGYLYESPGLVENYTSDGGAYWCAKTFMCLLMEEDHPFWTARAVPAPIEKEDYLVTPKNKAVTFTLSGTKACGVTVYNNISQYYQGGVYHNPFNDMASYYCKFAYNSRSGFALGTRDNVSFDNMISLQTPDRSMSSHRWGFADLGRRGDLLLSSHLPFSNDPGTRIETALLPLADGSHLRLHRVTLSQKYTVREGGFSIGLWSDYHAQTESGSSFCIENGTLWSRLTAAAAVPVSFYENIPQPGMHILAPHACYPAYTTALLPPGVYYFASACRVSGEKDYIMPRLTLLPDKLEILHHGAVKEIPFTVFS